MPPLKIQCAECDTWLKIAELPEHGKVRCPKCGITIKVQVVSRGRTTDDNEDDAPSRPRKKRPGGARRAQATGGGFNWGIILAVAGGGIIAGAIFLRYIFVNTQPVVDWEKMDQPKGGSSHLVRPFDPAIDAAGRWRGLDSPRGDCSAYGRDLAFGPLTPNSSPRRG